MGWLLSALLASPLLVGSSLLAPPLVPRLVALSGALRPRFGYGAPRNRDRMVGRTATAVEASPLKAKPESLHLSSPMSSMRQPLEMLSTVIVSPFTCGSQQVPPRL